MPRHASDENVFATISLAQRSAPQDVIASAVQRCFGLAAVVYAGTNAADGCHNQRVIRVVGFEAHDLVRLCQTTRRQVAAAHELMVPRDLTWRFGIVPRQVVRTTGIVGAPT